MILPVYKNKYMLNKYNLKVSENLLFIISWGIEIKYWVYFRKVKVTWSMNLKGTI